MLGIFCGATELFRPILGLHPPPLGAEAERVLSEAHADREFGAEIFRWTVGDPTSQQIVVEHFAVAVVVMTRFGSKSRMKEGFFFAGSAIRQANR